MQRQFILFLDELIQPFSKEHRLHELFTFLGTDAADFTYKNELRNQTVLPKYPNLLYYANKTGLTRSWKLNKWAQQLNFKGQKAGYPKLSIHMRGQLEEHFKDSNARLRELLGRSLPWD